jgi:hypothetical protein
MFNSKLGTIGAKELKEEVVPMKKNDLLSLIELGCLKQSVKIGDKTFVIRSLNTSERMYLSELDMLKESVALTAKDFLVLNIKILALAIETVDGVLLEDFHSDVSKDPLQRREEILANMQTAVLEKLIKEFNDLSTRASAQFDVEELKK